MASKVAASKAKPKTSSATKKKDAAPPDIKQAEPAAETTAELNEPELSLESMITAADDIEVSEEILAQVTEEFKVPAPGKKGKKKASGPDTKSSVAIPVADPYNATVLALKAEIESVTLTEGIVIQEQRRVYPTGCVGLDAAIGKIDPVYGNGGIPELAIVELYGPTGVRKSNFWEQMALRILNDDPNNIVVFLYSEDPDLARLRRMGMPEDGRFQILGLYNPSVNDTKQQLAEKRLMDLVEAAKYKNVKLIVIDSLKALVSATQMYKKGGESKDIIKPFEEDEVAIRAKLMEKLFNRLLFQRRSAILGMTNQLTDRIPNREDRFTIGAANQDKTPAGRMKEFLSVIRIKVEGKPLYNAAALEIGDKDSKYTPQEGILQVYKIKKNRWGRPNVRVTANFDFETGDYDRSLEVLTLGEHLGIITKGGAYYNISGNNIQGKQSALLFLDRNPEIRESLYKEIIRRGDEIHRARPGDKRANISAKAVIESGGNEYQASGEEAEE